MLGSGKQGSSPSTPLYPTDPGWDPKEWDFSDPTSKLQAAGASKSCRPHCVLWSLLCPPGDGMGSLGRAGSLRLSPLPTWISGLLPTQL